MTYNHRPADAYFSLVLIHPHNSHRWSCPPMALLRTFHRQDLYSFVLFSFVFLPPVKQDQNVSYKQSFIHFIVKYFHNILDVFYKKN